MGPTHAVAPSIHHKRHPKLTGIRRVARSTPTGTITTSGRNPSTLATREAPYVDLSWTITHTNLT